VIRALTPIGVGFDPRVPEQIARVHAQAADTKQRRLTAATAWTLTAAFMIELAVATTALTTPDPAPALHAALAEHGNGMQALVVRGQFSQGQQVVITATPAGQPAAPVSTLAVAGADGAIRGTVRVSAAPGYQVTATWTDRAGRWTLTKTLTPTSATAD
jgi:hypothetical protein